MPEHLSALDILRRAVERARAERIVPAYVPAGGGQYVTLPAWVAESLLTAMEAKG